MIIRAVFFISIFILFGSPAGAQDIIRKHTGESIEVIIVDVSPGVIKYKKFEKPEGPVYSIAREQVEKITYENGKTLSFEKEEERIEQHDREPVSNLARPSPTMGWHLGLGASDLYGDIADSKIQMASAIGASFTLPIGKSNTIMIEADILSVGCGIKDFEIYDQDNNKHVFTGIKEDLGYLGILLTDRFFLNQNRNFYIEAGGYGSFLMNASLSGTEEVTDTSGVVIGSGEFSEQVVQYYKPYDFGLAAGFGGRIPLGKSGKWHITAGARFYYGLTNIWDDTSIPGLEGYRESNIFGLFFVGVDIPTKSKE